MDFTFHKNLHELDPTKWNALLAESITDVPFLRYEYLNAWWETRGGGEWPQAELALVSASQGGDLVGIAPLFLAEHDGCPKLLLLGSIEISDYLDLIVRPADLPRFLPALLDVFASSYAPAWGGFDWYNLPEASPILPALRAESARRGWDLREEIYRPTPYIPLPGDFETYLAGIDKKQRHEIRRKMRRADEGSQRVRWYIVTDEATLDAEAEACCRLMAQDPAKQAFLTQTMRSQMKATIHAAFQAGYLQLAFMEVDGQKAAGYLNFDYGGRIWVYNSGLDQGFRELSPGWVLLGRLLQWANEHGRREFDFMRGDEEYKYRFGAVNRHVMRVQFGPQA
jgi:CelD/BcsL family acetyltransferase involved in cellulose biosynthesis